LHSELKLRRLLKPWKSSCSCKMRIGWRRMWKQTLFEYWRKLVFEDNYLKTFKRHFVCIFHFYLTTYKRNRHVYSKRIWLQNWSHLGIWKRFYCRNRFKQEKSHRILLWWSTTGDFDQWRKENSLISNEPMRIWRPFSHNSQALNRR